MDNTHFDEFSEILDLVAEQYNKTLSAGLKMLYWQGLCEYEFDAVKQALTRHLRNTDSGMFMPKIADVIKMMQGSSLDSALVAWSKVDKSVRFKGVYADVVFDDPLIHRVIDDMGGWIGFGDKKETEWPFIAKEFETRYRGYKQRNETPEYRPVLTGISNAYNASKGYKLDPVVLVGDKSKCERVMQLGSNKPAVGFSQLSSIKNQASIPQIKSVK